MLETERDELATAMRDDGEAQIAQGDRGDRRRSRARSADWSLRTDSWALVEPGLSRTYRDGRGALKRRPADASAENVHEWRKRAKDLWYQLRIIHDAWPELLGATVEQAHQLDRAARRPPRPGGTGRGPGPPPRPQRPRPLRGGDRGAPGGASRRGDRNRRPALRREARRRSGGGSSATGAPGAGPERYSLHQPGIISPSPSWRAPTASTSIPSGAGLEGTDHLGRDPDRVERLDLDDLVVEFESCPEPPMTM